MIYLNSFEFPNDSAEFDFIIEQKMTCYESFYPFKILSRNNLERIDFEEVTILYGGNGSGKSTALNVIAEKIKANRDSLYNKSPFFSEYVDMCEAKIEEEGMDNIKIITSDDIFDYILNIRNFNEGIDLKRDELFEEYLDAKYSNFQMNSISEYEKLKKSNKAKKNTKSQFVKSELISNVREYSNGETSFKYFLEKIDKAGIYILDEPENSLSPNRQLELMNFIEESVRYEGCQFIISTHSPFLLGMRKAKIYDLDENPVYIKKWTELENVRVYYEFFKRYEEDLKNMW